jgi:hypothetical protein
MDPSSAAARRRCRAAGGRPRLARRGGPGPQADMATLRPPIPEERDSSALSASTFGWSRSRLGSAARWRRGAEAAAGRAGGAPVPDRAGALGNVARHAHGGSVRVEPYEDSDFVDDDGVGFDQVTSPGAASTTSVWQACVSGSSWPPGPTPRGPDGPAHAALRTAPRCCRSSSSPPAGIRRWKARRAAPRPTPTCQGCSSALVRRPSPPADPGTFGWLCPPRPAGTTCRGHPGRATPARPSGHR